MKKRNKYYNYVVLTEQTPLKSSDRNDILQWIYDIHIVEWCVTYLMKKNIDNDDVKDKIQDIFLILAEKNQDVWDNLYEQGKYAVSAYVAGVAHRQIISDCSALYKKYNLHNQMEITQDDNFWENYGENH